MNQGHSQNISHRDADVNLIAENVTQDKTETMIKVIVSVNKQ